MTSWVASIVRDGLWVVSFVCDGFAGRVVFYDGLIGHVSDGLIAFVVDRLRHDCCVKDGFLCTARVTNQGRFNLGTFSENEYFSHHVKTIVVAWRLSLVYIDITSPH
ncbi:hypothetical protein TNCV_2761341 [Trichonephila clavipes]|nr:hypothetical protein TNCV_2761341 [Trichonephila clavipes]